MQIMLWREQLKVCKQLKGCARFLGGAKPKFAYGLTTVLPMITYRLKIWGPLLKKKEISALDTIIKRCGLTNKGCLQTTSYKSVHALCGMYSMQIWIIRTSLMALLSEIYKRQTGALIKLFNGRSISKDPWEKAIKCELRQVMRQEKMQNSELGPDVTVRIEHLQNSDIHMWC